MGLHNVTQQNLYSNLRLCHGIAWHSDNKVTLIKMLGKYTVPL